jgi:hypothetical protein
LPTTPTGRPSRRAKPHTIDLAQCGKYSKKSPSSTIVSMTLIMSYGTFGLSGMRSYSSGQRRCGSSVGTVRGGSSKLFSGRKEIR